MTEERQPDEVLQMKVREWLRQQWAGIETNSETGKQAMLDAAAIRLTIFIESIQAEARQHCAHCFCECPECNKP